MRKKVVDTQRVMINFSYIFKWRALQNECRASARHSKISAKLDFCYAKLVLQYSQMEEVYIAFIKVIKIFHLNKKGIPILTNIISKI